MMQKGQELFCFSICPDWPLGRPACLRSSWRRALQSVCEPGDVCSYRRGLASRSEHLGNKKINMSYPCAQNSHKYKAVFRKQNIELHWPLAIASLTNFVLEVKAYKVSSTICRPKWCKKRACFSNVTLIMHRAARSTNGKPVTFCFLLTGWERVQQQQKVGQHQRLSDVANAFLVWGHRIHGL